MVSAPRWLARPRGYALIGEVWPGADSTTYPGGVIIGPAGRLERIVIGSASQVLAQLPEGLGALGDDSSWIGPAIIDAHVHLGLAPGGSARRPLGAIGPGLGGVRDLGSPADDALRLRAASRRSAGRDERGAQSQAGWAFRSRWAGGPHGPAVAVSGPILTSPGGYPSTTWGAGSGVSTTIASSGQARLVVRSLAARGVDVIKVALEPGASGLPTPSRAVLRSIVEAAHEAGLPVVAHALRARMVVRALDCGVDELAHTPTERLPDEVIERIVDARVGVVSTLQTFFSDGEGADAGGNAAALVRAGGILRYGTDLGNTGTVTGVDPRELDRLAHAGLGRLGALRAATEGSAGAAGMHGPTGVLTEGAAAALVLLDGDPLRDPAVWRAPIATVLGTSRRVAAGAQAAAPARQSVSGGQSVTGGQPLTGGQSVSGGQPVTGGQPVSGGQSVSGGQPVTGGQSVSGGQSLTGAGPATGRWTGRLRLGHRRRA